MNAPQIATSAWRGRSAADGGAISPVRWAARIVVIAIVVILVRGGAGFGAPGLAQDASPMASPVASPSRATPEGAMGPTTQVVVGEVTIEIMDEGIAPVHFESAVGRDVTITVVNASERQRTFVMEDFDVDFELEPGEEETFTLEQPEIGTYTYTSEAPDGDELSGTMTVFI